MFRCRPWATPANVSWRRALVKAGVQVTLLRRDSGRQEAASALTVTSARWVGLEDRFARVTVSDDPAHFWRYWNVGAAFASLRRRQLWDLGVAAEQLL